MSQKKTLSQFILDARNTHGWKYDYSKVEYFSCMKNVCIICPEHGEFWQAPNSHLRGQGCPECAKIYKANKISLNNEIFIEKAKKVHGDKYDYSKVEYRNSKIKVCIICPEHGEFWQRAYIHLGGCGCIKCAKDKNKKHVYLNTEKFIEKSKDIHGDKYDYSKVEYRNIKEKVCIICPEHGEFWQRAEDHLKGRGCSKCSGRIKENNDFITKCKNKHGDVYDYNQTIYKNLNTKISYLCPSHGVIHQLPSNHLKYGCPECGKEYYLLEKKDEYRKIFFDKINKMHNKYDYSKVEYKNSKTKVCIICPEHGEFWQTPSKHIKSGQGCPKCQSSHLENEVRRFLIEKEINFIEQYAPRWLKSKKGQKKIDFYLPEYNVAIECQGIQHFIDVEYFKTRINLTQKRDEEKNKLSKLNNIDIIYYVQENDIKFLPNNSIYNNNNVFTSIKELYNSKLNIKNGENVKDEK